jgi:hypothetical protein
MKKLCLLLLLYNFVEAMNEGSYKKTFSHKLNKPQEIKNHSNTLKTLPQRIEETYSKAQESINYLSTLPRNRDKRICKILPEANIEAQMLREIYNESQQTQLSNEEVQKLRNKWFANASNVKRLHDIVFPLIEEDQSVKLKKKLQKNDLNKPQHAMENSSNAKEDIEGKFIEKMDETPNKQKFLPNTIKNRITWFMKLIRYKN